MKEALSEILDLNVRHTNNAPVFVIGAARSGTSILCSLIRRYLKTSFGTESQFIIRVHQALARYGDLRHDANLRRLVDDIASWIWVLIPLAAIGIAPFKMWLRVKEKQMEAQTSLTAEKSAQYAAHVERIEARLRVVEQIVTDGGAQTASQIEALRDHKKIESKEF